MRESDTNYVDHMLILSREQERAVIQEYNLFEHYKFKETKELDWIYNGMLILSRKQENEFLFDPKRKDYFQFHDWLLYKKKTEWIEKIKGIEKAVNSFQCNYCLSSDCECREKLKINDIIEHLRHRIIWNSCTVFLEHIDMIPRPEFCQTVATLDDVMEQLAMILLEIRRYCGPQHFAASSGFYEEFGRADTYVTMAMNDLNHQMTFGKQRKLR